MYLKVQNEILKRVQSKFILNGDFLLLRVAYLNGEAEEGMLSVEQLTLYPPKHTPDNDPDIEQASYTISDSDA